MNAPDTVAPDSIADDLIVGAADLARFIYGSDEQRFQRRIYYRCSVAKLRLPHFRLGSQIAARRSTLLAWIEEWEAFSHG
jgi:hypothetical protein